MDFEYEEEESLQFMEEADDDSSSNFESQVQDDGDNETEEEQVLLRLLISFVRENSILYDKSHKDFLNTAKKSMTWTTIGNQVGMTGKEAETAFYKLRQKFNKLLNRKARSGAAGGVAIVPAWLYFEDMMFLKDHTSIRPRARTSSNYVRGGAVKKSQKEVSPNIVGSTTSGRGTVNQRRGLLNNVALGMRILRSPSPTVSEAQRRSLLSNQLSRLTGAAPGTSTSTGHDSDSSPNPVEMFRLLSSPTVEQQIEAQTSDSGLSTVDTEFAATHRTTNISTPKAPKKTTPPPDKSFYSRRATSEAIGKELLKSNNQLEKLASALTNVVEKSTPAEAPAKESPPEAPILRGLSAQVQAMLPTVGLALSKVREEDQLRCLVDFLNLVEEKYCKI